MKHCTIARWIILLMFFSLNFQPSLWRRVHGKLIPGWEEVDACEFYSKARKVRWHLTFFFQVLCTRDGWNCVKSTMKRDQDTLLLSSESTHVLVIETVTGITSWVVSCFPVGQLRHAGLLMLIDDTEQSLQNKLRQKNSQLERRRTRDVSGWKKLKNYN